LAEKARQINDKFCYTAAASTDTYEAWHKRTIVYTNPLLLLLFIIINSQYLRVGR